MRAGGGVVHVRVAQGDVERRRDENGPALEGGYVVAERQGHGQGNLSAGRIAGQDEIAVAGDGADGAPVRITAVEAERAAGPIAGQNFGAGNAGRVRETFIKAVSIGTVVMIAITILAQWKPGLLLDGFSNDRETMAVAAQFLQDRKSVV